jgi:hypothetical protein
MEGTVMTQQTLVHPSTRSRPVGSLLDGRFGRTPSTTPGSPFCRRPDHGYDDHPNQLTGTRAALTAREWAMLMTMRPR